MAETLPGLMVAQHQQVRWHLLNVGGDKEFHAVHFHGLPFTVHTKQEHRMGVFSLFPGRGHTDIPVNPPCLQKSKNVLQQSTSFPYVVSHAVFSMTVQVFLGLWR